MTGPPIKTPEELAEFVPNGPALICIALAPMMHGAAMWASLISLLAGHTVVVNDQRHFDAEHVWDIAERDGVSILSTVGDTMALPLIQGRENHPGRWYLSHVMVLGNAGRVYSRHLQARLKAVRLAERVQRSPAGKAD